MLELFCAKNLLAKSRNIREMRRFSKLTIMQQQQQQQLALFAWL